MSSQTTDWHLSRMTDPYMMGYFSSSKGVIVTDGPGTVPRFEVYVGEHIEAVPFLEAMRIKLSAGRREGDVLIIDDPQELRRVLSKYVLHDPFKADQARKALRALPPAPAAAAGRSSARQQGSGRGGDETAAPSSSSTHVAGNPPTAAAEQQQQQQRGSKKQRACAGCGGEAAKRCSACRDVWYCSKDCQAADWPTHKLHCKSRAS